MYSFIIMSLRDRCFTGCRVKPGMTGKGRRRIYGVRAKILTLRGQSKKFEEFLL